MLLELKLRGWFLNEFVIFRNVLRYSYVDFYRFQLLIGILTVIQEYRYPLWLRI